MRRISGGQLAVVVAILVVGLLITGGARISGALGAIGGADPGALDGPITDPDCAPESFTAWYCPPREGSSHFTRKYPASMPSWGRGGDFDCPM